MTSTTFTPEDLWNRSCPVSYVWEGRWYISWENMGFRLFQAQKNGSTANISTEVRALVELAPRDEPATHGLTAAEHLQAAQAAGLELTDEMVERGARQYVEEEYVSWRRAPETVKNNARESVHGILRAALTEPPTRPEGAEELAAAEHRADEAERVHRDLTSQLGFGDGITEPMADNETIIQHVGEAVTAEQELWELTQAACVEAGCDSEEDCYDHHPVRRAERAEHRAIQAEAERDKAERAAQTLGKVIDDQCRDIARITRSEHMVDADGDADWEEIWSRGHDMATRLEQATDRVDVLREEVARTVREKDEWEANAEKAERALAEVTAHRDRCRDSAIKRQVEVNRLRAEQPDPLTPGDYQRAWRMFLHHEDRGNDRDVSVRAAVNAALTEPPRPEWETSPYVWAWCADGYDHRCIYTRHEESGVTTWHNTDRERLRNWEMELLNPAPVAPEQKED